jgi:UDP-N-acetylglucosamine acyltransferase
MRHLAPVISRHAVIGDGCEIGHGAIIYANVEIGDGCYIGAHAIIGAPPQHHGSYPAPLSGAKYEHGVKIGRGACVREFCAIHAGVVGPTMIGDGALVMAYSHVSHDSIVGGRATIGSASILGGFSMIDERVTFGQGVVTHPWIIVGEGAMVGLNSSVVKDVLPYQKVAGAPARLLGPNAHLFSADEWSEASLADETWTRWAALNDKRDKLREEWARV